MFESLVCSPVGTVWEGGGGVALLEEVYYRSMGVGILVVLCLWLVVRM